MKSVTVSGKTIEKAIEEGLKLLNTPFENVDINVISEGGLFKKATVELTLTEEYLEKQNKLKQEEKPLQPQIEEKVTETQTSLLTQEDDEDLQAKIESIEKEIQQLQGVTEEPKEKFEDQVINYINEFLNGLLNAFCIIAKVETEYSNRVFNVKIIGENLGVLIGYHGDALEAIQCILQNYIANKTQKAYKIVLDIENYRSKRAQALQAMAEKIAKKVVENKKSYKLEPMSSYERKVIHTYLQDYEHVKTHSEGVEPNRYLVIEYVD